LGGNVSVGGSGYSEFAEYITAGKMRAIGVTSEKRLPGINVPTMREQGYDVVLGNWRGVYGAPGITPEQRAALTDMIVKVSKSKGWAEALEKNGWMPAVLTGKAFDDFVDSDFASLRGIMHLSGMLS
jgi:putative tricarboxylic transport membrane protein